MAEHPRRSQRFGTWRKEVGEIDSTISGHRVDRRYTFLIISVSF